MPKDGYVGKSVKCPFYHREERQLLKCEGPIIGTTTHLVFGNKEDKDLYKRLYCNKKYCDCLINKMLSEYKHMEGQNE